MGVSHVEGRCTVRGPLGGQRELCARLLADLPGWFGIPESNAAYARAADALPGFVATVDGVEAGLLLVRETSEAAAEIHLIAVLSTYHRMGLGGALVRAAEAHLRGQGVRWFHVKTLGPSVADANYAATRAFYEAMGFEPLEEIEGLWGPENPCLLMVKRLEPGVA